MRRALMFGVLALFAVGCSTRPMGGDTGWKVYGPAGPQGVADGPDPPLAEGLVVLVRPAGIRVPLETDLECRVLLHELHDLLDRVTLVGAHIRPVEIEEDVLEGLPASSGSL